MHGEVDSLHCLSQHYRIPKLVGWQMARLSNQPEGNQPVWALGSKGKLEAIKYS